VISERIAAVQRRINDACARAGRDPREVTLVAVSKTMANERIVKAHAAGMRHFGENRVQEGIAKIEELSALEGVTWHLIGHLQTNKAKHVARLFDLVHSIDSVRVAEVLSGDLVKREREQDVLLQVNYADESSKFGLEPDAAVDEARRIAALPGLRVRGLMTVAPFVPDPEIVRPVFRGMRELSERVRDAVQGGDGWQLSMGMTDDYPVAIEEGSTILRIGRAIFGERPSA